MDTLFIALSVAGVVTSLVLILFLFRLRSGNLLGNKMLGVLFIFLTIRIGKATLYYYFDINELAIYIGLSAFLGIGPLSYLYFQIVLGNLRKLSGIHYIHLAPPLVVLVAGFLLSPKMLSFLQPYLYQIILVYFLVYLCQCGYLFFKYDLHHFSKTQKGRNRFLLHLLGSITLIYIVYAIDLFVGIDVYVFGGLFYCVIIYLFLYKSLIDKNIYHEIGRANKFQYINKEAIDVDQKIAEIDGVMQEKKLYLNPNLTIDEVAKCIGITKHQLSELINTKYGYGFPSYINHYRLEQAKELLIEAENHNISEIAYASGFNSISTFNTLFKKETAITPTQFRKK